MVRLGCIQPSYIPWKGYFHVIQRSDMLVFHDDIQYTKQDWRNRNRIKRAGGPTWLTIPVRGVSSDTLINRVEIDSAQRWNEKHWRTMEQAYRQAPYFERYAEGLQALFARRWAMLADCDIAFTQQICSLARHSRCAVPA